MDETKRQQLRSITEFVGNVIASPYDYPAEERVVADEAVEALAGMLAEMIHAAELLEGILARKKAAEGAPTER